MCVSETHLKGNDTILIDNYNFFPHNRTVSHVNAPKMFRGVGTFVKENMFNLFDVSVIDESFEGIQGLLFNDKNSGIKLITYSGYLAPYGSPYGYMSTDLLAHLITQLYINSEIDMSYIYVGILMGGQVV